ncbi:MAG: hypothetical protein AB7K86_23255, partial [Rhodospirillales bacterium]
PAAPVDVPRRTAAAGDASYVDWGAIFAGAVFAAALSFLMLAFGAAIGLTLTSPHRGEGASLTAIAVVSALWLLWVQVSSFAAGGYVTGRLRRRLFEGTPHEADMRDGLHGLVVWGIGALAAMLLAASTIAGAARTGAEVAATAASGIAAGAMTAAGGAAAAASGQSGPSGQGAQSSPADPFGYTVDLMFRSDAQPAPGDTAASRQEAVRILAAGAASGSIPQEDRAYLARIVSARTGLSQPEAEARVNEVIAQARATAQAAEEKAREAADQARKAAILVAFLSAASLLVGAAAAWWAARLGGTHRDEGTDFSAMIRTRRSPSVPAE